MRAAQDAGLPTSLSVVPFRRGGWCPGWAAWPWRGREAHRAGAMPPPAARRRPGAAEQPLPLPPAGLRTSFSSFFFLLFFSSFPSSSPPPLHSCLIHYLPSFSQIYQHLAFAWTHSHVSPGEEQRQRDSFLKGLGRRPPPGGRGSLSGKGAPPFSCVRLDKPSIRPASVSPSIKTSDWPSRRISRGSSQPPSSLGVLELPSA